MLNFEEMMGMTWDEVILTLNKYMVTFVKNECQHMITVGETRLYFTNGDHCTRTLCRIWWPEED